MREQKWRRIKGGTGVDPVPQRFRTEDLVRHSELHSLDAGSNVAGQASSKVRA